MAFYDPTAEHLEKLTGSWCCSFSGGKDSTSLVTWIEWLRRAGWITVEKPKLVNSDTGVEYPELQAISEGMMNRLRDSGWECQVVNPRVQDKLYCMILGRGVTPIHPGIRNMRWCTRSTKIDPMERWRDENAEGLTLTGLRHGESAMRDGKLKKRGCSAGGECGIPDPSERTYSPIINWTLCQVIDWLNGAVRKDVYRLVPDLFHISRQLVEIYGVKIGQPTFDFQEPQIEAARFGCIGCPAIQADRHAPKSVVRRHGADSPLCELYDVWFEARRRKNRCFRQRAFKGKLTNGYGPIKMEVRKVLFGRIMDIQRRAGIELVTPEDETFIRQCWVNKVYPKGWTEADETNEPPMEPLYKGGKV